MGSRKPMKHGQHGERVTRHDEWDIVANSEGFDETDQMDEMLVDLAAAHPLDIDDEPTVFAQALYRMVASADELVHEKTTLKFVCCCSFTCCKITIQHVNCRI